jgi:hypothetical protein
VTTWKEEEEEGVLTNNEWVSVGRHNTLLGGGGGEGKFIQGLTPWRRRRRRRKDLFKANAVNEDDSERRATLV